MDDFFQSPSNLKVRIVHRSNKLIFKTFYQTHWYLLDFWTIFKLIYSSFSFLFFLFCCLSWFLCKLSLMLCHGFLNKFQNLLHIARNFASVNFSINFWTQTFFSVSGWYRRWLQETHAVSHWRTREQVKKNCGTLRTERANCWTRGNLNLHHGSIEMNEWRGMVVQCTHDMKDIRGQAKKSVIFKSQLYQETFIL